MWKKGDNTSLSTGWKQFQVLGVLKDQTSRQVCHLPTHHHRHLFVVFLWPPLNVFQGKASKVTRGFHCQIRFIFKSAIGRLYCVDVWRRKGLTTPKSFKDQVDNFASSGLTYLPPPPSFCCLWPPLSVFQGKGATLRSLPTPTIAIPLPSPFFCFFWPLLSVFQEKSGRAYTGSFL